GGDPSRRSHRRAGPGLVAPHRAAVHRGGRSPRHAMNRNPARRRPSLLLLVASLLLAAPVPGDDSAAGVVVEEVARDSAAEKAGIQPGDVIVSWPRGPAPPANPQPAQGAIASTFDLGDIEVEQAPRGPLLLAGRRGPAAMTWALPPVLFGLRSRPLLADGLL